MFLFDWIREWKSIKTCKSCETLKEQLGYYRDENKRLNDVLLDLVRPKIETIPEPQVIAPVQAVTTFSRRRAALEEKDRLQAKTLKESVVMAKPDDIEELEQQVGLKEN